MRSKGISLLCRAINPLRTIRRSLVMMNLGEQPEIPSLDRYEETGQNHRQGKDPSEQSVDVDGQHHGDDDGHYQDENRPDQQLPVGTELGLDPFSRG